MTVFNGVDYLNKTSCTVLAELDEGVTTIELRGLDEQTLLFDVYSGAVRRINMPRIRGTAPSALREPFESGIGLGLVLCNILEQDQTACLIQPPSVDETEAIRISRSMIAREIWNKETK